MTKGAELLTHSISLLCRIKRAILRNEMLCFCTTNFKAFPVLTWHLNQKMFSILTMIDKYFNLNPLDFDQMILNFRLDFNDIMHRQFLGIYFLLGACCCNSENSLDKWREKKQIILKKVNPNLISIPMVLNWYLFWTIIWNSVYFTRVVYLIHIA